MVEASRRRVVHTRSKEARIGVVEAHNTTWEAVLAWMEKEKISRCKWLKMVAALEGESETSRRQREERGERRETGPRPKAGRGIAAEGGSSEVWSSRSRRALVLYCTPPATPCPTEISPRQQAIHPTQSKQRCGCLLVHKRPAGGLLHTSVSSHSHCNHPDRTAIEVPVSWELRALTAGLDSTFCLQTWPHRQTQGPGCAHVYPAYWAEGRLAIHRTISSTPIWILPVFFQARWWCICYPGRTLIVWCTWKGEMIMGARTWMTLEGQSLLHVALLTGFHHLTLDV